MSYAKIGNLIRMSTPTIKAKPSRFTPEQLDKLATVGRVALAIVAGAGIITLTAVAPNIWWAVDRMFGKKYPNRKFAKQEKDRIITQAFYYMKRSGLIKMKITGSDIRIALTKLGEKKFARLNISAMSVPKQKVWNGRWWQVAADIPTKQFRRGADLLRQKLRDMNFFPLQRTLWFHPFDPRQEIEDITNFFGIERFVTVMEVNRLDKDDEQKMKKFFIELKILGKEKIN